MLQTGRLLPQDNADQPNTNLLANQIVTVRREVDGVIPVSLSLCWCHRRVGYRGPQVKGVAEDVSMYSAAVPAFRRPLKARTLTNSLDYTP